MQATRKYESLCLSRDERFIFAGDISGYIHVLSAQDLSLASVNFAHPGTIIAMSASTGGGWFACLSMDRSVSLWNYDGEGRLERFADASIRNLAPANDPVTIEIVSSNAQTLAAHPSQRRIVTRTGNAGVTELDFSTGVPQVLSCTRLHRNWDVVSAAYASDDDLVLTGSGDGEVVLSRQGEFIRGWQVSDESVHWFEPLGGGEFLVASDARLVARLDINAPEVNVVGPRFAVDDLEHVRVNAVSGRAFASSFDRRIHEVDPVTCRPIGTVFEAPFKCRWLHTFASDPDRLLAQTRDGGLHLVDIAERRATVSRRLTPKAVWTADHLQDGSLALAGEGDVVTYMKVNAADPLSLQPTPSIRKLAYAPLSSASYTKRIARLPQTPSALLLARTDGTLVRLDGGSVDWIAELNSAVRDIAVHPSSPEVVAVCENGDIWKVDTRTGETLGRTRGRTDLPVWSVAVQPCGQLFAALERYGDMSILRWDDLSLHYRDADAGKPKRAKWLDDDCLLHSHGSEVFRYNPLDGRHECFLDRVGNTVEDFLWDAGHNYLVTLSYTTMLSLYDLQTGQFLSSVTDQLDYSKGLAWLDAGSGGALHPFDFVTFGRSGWAHLFRIHNEALYSLGPLASLL